MRILPVALLAFVAVINAAPAALAVDNQNCRHFPSQAAAQAHLRADPSDPDGLDAHVGPADGNDRAGGDGIACEGNRAPVDTARVFAPNAPNHGTTVPGALPSTGPHNPMSKAAVGGLLLVAGAALLWMAKHRRSHTS